MDMTDMLAQYFSLHVHSIKSINDSILKIDDYIKKAKELGLHSLSLTNHGTMSDVFEFYKKCKKENIKPIIGCEVYVVDDRLEKTRGYAHLVLIAINKKGFENLIAIHNDAQIIGKYYKPRTDLSFLSKHGEGIIALSACVGGELPKMILNAIALSEDDEADYNEEEHINNMIEYINTYKTIFDDFYLEIQPGDFMEQVVVNESLISLSEMTNTKLVVTNDVHYLNEEDYLAHNIHVCAGQKKEVTENILYPDKCYYMMDRNDLENKLLKYIDSKILDEAIINVNNIANRVEDYDIIPEKIYMPKFDVPVPYTEDGWLEKICFDKLDKIKYRLDDIAEYTERLMYELRTIRKLGFSGYFLTVQDYVLWAKNNDIQVGPGRGSVCGCLVAYLTDITKVDPVKYNLLFERFLSEHRPSPPDVDLDFDAKKRDLVFNYVVNKYGKDHCALVSTFSERKAKAALKDTGRTFGIPKEICDEVAGLVPTVFYMDDEDGNSEKKTDLSIEDTMDLVPQFKEYAEQYPDWINAAIKLSNIPKATSVHAAGTIISPVKLGNIIPLIPSKNEDLLATALNLKDAESAGLIKFDFLSISTLGTIDKCLKMIGVKDVYDIMDEEYDDPKVWEIIGSKYTAGLFQISSATYRQRMGRLAPETIKQLAACLALVRGPCIASKADEKYMRIIEGKEEIELIHPIYDEVTHDTNGILIYQEQLMMICFKMGFTLDEGYKIMKLSSKKEMKELKKYESRFMELSKTKNMTPEVASRIFKMIVDSGLYSFNESHGVAYAILCYITAFLKTYYPREFLAASLTNAYERKEEVSELIAECRRLGIKFDGLDINSSDWDFTLIRDNEIKIGFSAIKGFGYKAYEELIAHRPFNSMEEMLEKVAKKNLGKRPIIPAIFSGAFDLYYNNRLEAYEDYCNLSGNDFEEQIKIQGSDAYIKVNATDIEFEETFLGACLISDPVNHFAPIGIDDIPKSKAFNILGLCDKIKKHKDRNGNQMAFLTIKTGDGILEAVVFSNQYTKYKQNIKKGLICLFNLNKSTDGYIVNSIEASAA